MKTDVFFDSNGIRLAGVVHTPDAPTEVPGPAVVIGHPVTGVKEQSPTVYAERLADRGYVALVFDAAYQGDSGGRPHGLEDPFQRSEDFRNAVTYLTTRDDVDADRIGVLGICGSGGYVPHAAQTDHRMKAVATVSAVDIPDLLRSPDPKAWQQMVQRSGELRTAEAKGADPVLVPAIPELDELDDSAPQPVREFVDYYKTPRGQHPNSTNRWVMRSADRLDQYDSYADVAKIAPRPLLMVAGTEAHSLSYSRDAVAAAGDSAELFTVEGATHVDLYDRPEFVDVAVERLEAFFGEHLSKH